MILCYKRFTFPRTFVVHRQETALSVAE